MEKKHKIILGVGIGVVVLGTIAYFIFRKPKPTEEGFSDGEVLNSTDPILGNSATNTNVNNPLSPIGSAADLYSPTPFKSQSSGDTFRVWVNKWHGDYAKEINLDPKGKIDNSYIRKAWQKYGQEYINAGGKI